MSSSYSALNQKYNTLLALVLEGGTGGGGGSQSLQDVINVSDTLNGSAPTTNQVIKYDGTNVVWGTGGTTAQDLQSVLDTGNVTTNNAIFGNSTEITTISNTGLLYQNNGVNTTIGSSINLTDLYTQVNLTSNDIILDDSVDNSLMTISSGNINIVKNTTKTLDLEITTQPILTMVSTNGTTTVSDLAVKSAKLDAYTAGALGIGETTATVINIGKNSVTTANKGLLTSANGVQTQFFDTITAQNMNVGITNATSVTVAKTGINTNIRGTCSIGQGLKTTDIDTSTSVALNIGAVTATPLNLSRTGIDTSIKGTASVAQLLTATSGMVTNTIDTITSTGLTIGGTTANAITIGSSTTTPPIVIDTASILNSNATPAISIGTSASTKTIKIGNNTNSVHLASLDVTGQELNNIVPTTGAISIGFSQTSGVLGLGNGASRSGAVNICDGTSSTAIVNIGTGTTRNGAINVGTGTSALGGVNIGSTTNSVDVKGTSVKISAGAGYGTAGNVLLSGGSGASASWGSLFQSGSISTPVAGVATLQAFPTTITTSNSPVVILTYDYGAGATNIVNVGLAGFQGGTGAWTGFYYLTSSSGVASSKINWIAII